MNEYKIYPLINMVLNNEQSMQTYTKNFGKRIDTPIVFFLIQGNGVNILVDSGACDAETATKNHHPCTQTEDMLPANLVRAHGVEPEDIDTIIISHLHWDHCYNLEVFPNAKIYVQRRELRYAIDPLPIHDLFYEAPSSGLRAPWLDHLDRMVVMDGDYTIADGIDVLLMPGHTPGMQNVLVNTSAGRYLIATDNIPSMLNWEGIGSWKHVPSTIHNDLDAYWKTLERMEKVCDYILPGHDMIVREHPVYPDPSDCCEKNGG